MNNDKDLDALVNEVAEYHPVRNSYQFAILMGLNATGKHVYAGTVPEAEKTKRRKANRVARDSRKKNRK